MKKKNIHLFGRLRTEDAIRLREAVRPIFRFIMGDVKLVSPKKGPDYLQISYIEGSDFEMEARMLYFIKGFVLGVDV